MRGTARKFTSRAPRYTLKASDNRFLRFAHSDETGKSYSTHFVDISTTGLAFVTDRENAPALSDLIKVEIPLDAASTVTAPMGTKHPGTIAWWARVVRIEEYADHKWYLRREDFPADDLVMVAITFHELPPHHERLIRDTLNKKFDELSKVQKRAHFRNMAYFIASHIWQIFVYGLCIFAAGAFLYHITRPDPNYDADKGAPWGQRFPSLNIFKDDK